MNRTIIRTSLAWAAVVLLVVAEFVYKDRKASSHPEPDTTIQPIAVGSAQGATAI